MMELRAERVAAELLDPQRDFAPACTVVEVRRDPLTGHTARVLPHRGLT
jgi:hypothetical protein